VPTTDHATTEANKALVTRYLDGLWGEGRWEAAEEAIAPDAVFHDQLREGGFPPGRAGIRVAYDRIRSGMPDFAFTIEDLIAEGDRVVVRWSSTGTHSGDFNGMPPTGRRATMHGIAIVRIEDGRIVEGWQEADRLGLGQDLGMVPKGSMPRPVAKAMAAAVRFRDRRGRR
jgi:steroid delta-isomerase-like uncharacterized protein